VLEYMRKRLADIQEETGNMYNLEATPAEGAAYRLARIDREKIPDIKSSGRKEPYYTNSVHAPVESYSDLFELLEHQDDLQVKFTGGTVVHLFFGENIQDWHTVRALTRKITQRFRLPYFSFTPTFSISPVSGYIPGIHTYDPLVQDPADFERYGVLVEMDEEELKKMPAGSYLLVDNDNEKLPIQ